MHFETFNALQFNEITVRYHEDAKISFTILWAPTFDTGETVSSSTWYSKDSSLVIASQSNDTISTTAVIQASNPGTFWMVNLMTDSSGDIQERKVKVVFYDENEDLKNTNYDYWYSR